MKLLDGGFQAGEESPTGRAAIEAFFRSYAERIIQAFINIVGELMTYGQDANCAFSR